MNRIFAVTGMAAVAVTALAIPASAAPSGGRVPVIYTSGAASQAGRSVSGTGITAVSAVIRVPNRVPSACSGPWLYAQVTGGGIRFYAGVLPDGRGWAAYAEVRGTSFETLRVTAPVRKGTRVQVSIRFRDGTAIMTAAGRSVRSGYGSVRVRSAGFFAGWGTTPRGRCGAVTRFSGISVSAGMSGLTSLESEVTAGGTAAGHVIAAPGRLRDGGSEFGVRLGG
jgi:hypothetical protein